MSRQAIKTSCACAYESEAARYLLGDSYHPGGLELTARLGELLDLDGDSRVLDIAAGTGASALFLARRFGCMVHGVDYSATNVEQATSRADAESLAERVTFTRADAEALPFDDGTFDAILCECSFCLFPDKDAAVWEMARLLSPDGRVAISDLTREGPLADGLSGLLAWVSCIGDALPIEGYADCLSRTGLNIETIERHDEALIGLAEQVQMRLLAAEIVVGLREPRLPRLDFSAARQMAREAIDAIERGQLGYAVVTASKPQQSSYAADRNSK